MIDVGVSFVAKRTPDGAYALLADGTEFARVERSTLGWEVKLRRPDGSYNPFVVDQTLTTEHAAFSWARMQYVAVYST